MPRIESELEKSRRELAELLAEEAVVAEKKKEAAAAAAGCGGGESSVPANTSTQSEPLD